jgi:hypothetical protein
MIPMIFINVLFVITKMNFKLYIFIFLINISSLSLAQTEEQKEMMFKHINSKSSATYVSILPKIKSIDNKEILFSEAKIYPVYKIVFDKSNKKTFVQNKNYYLVFYQDKLYQFIDDEKSEFFKDNPVLKTISRLNLEKKDFKITYIADSFSLGSKNLNPLIFDTKTNSIIYRDKTYTLSEFIDYKYGSIDKIKELVTLDSLRDNLKMTDYYAFMKTNYELFNYYCPKDTTLVLKTLINQIKLATKDFTSEQESKLINRIKQKINPFEEFKKIKSGSESDISFLKTKDEEYKKGVLNVTGFYEYKIYNVSITNELLEILTTQQFTDYKKFIDLWTPPVEIMMLSYNNKYRYTYGKEIVKKEGIKYKHYMYFTDKILEDCGCPYDETVEGRKKRIILGG